MALLTKPGLIQLKIEDSGQLITTQVNKINFSGSVSASVGDFNDITITVGIPATASFAVSSSQAVSSSYALTASYVEGASSFPFSGSALITGSLGITGSLSVSGSTTLSGSLNSTGSVIFRGLINQSTAQSHVVTFNNTTGQLFITASSAFGGGGGAGTPGGANTTIQFNDAGVLSGSGNFTLLGGNAVSLTGSLLVTGSTRFIGSVTGSSFTGSFTGSLLGTGSWALSASTALSSSWAITASSALTSSWAISASQAITASFVRNAVSASYVLLAESASYVLNAISASYVLSASYALSSSQAVSSSWAISSSRAITASAALTSSWAVSASQAISSSYILLAESASYVLNAVSASYVLNAVSASYVLNAVSASFAVSSLRAITSSFSLVSNQIIAQNIVSNFGYNIPFLSGTGSTSTLYYSATGPKYNPITDVLLATSSWAQTASYVLNSNAFPYTGSAEITGSLSVTGSIYQVNPNTYSSASQEYIDQTLGPGTVIIFNKPFAIPISVFIEYFIIDTITGADQRAGIIMASFNSTGTPTQVFTETTTMDIGNTTAITFAAVSTPNFEIQATNAGLNSYQFRATLRYY
jgi:hypothetical protein